MTVRVTRGFDELSCRCFGVLRSRCWVVGLLAALLRAPPAQAATWTPPIGIPEPSFGIHETHYMYEGAFYDFGNGPEAYPDAGNGPYTHYVDNTAPNCNDANNGGYGSATEPRCGLPRSFSPSAGSVVEIHGGPYVHGGWWQWTPTGTVDQPVFIRGVDVNNKVVIEDTQLRLGGQYSIIENFEFYNDSSVRIKYNSPEHFALRYSEIHNPIGSFVGWGAAISTEGNDIVIYNNHIHHNVRLHVDGVRIIDCHGVVPATGSQRVWVIDNHIHHNSGDAVQACHNCSRPLDLSILVGT